MGIQDLKNKVRGGAPAPAAAVARRSRMFSGQEKIGRGNSPLLSVRSTPTGAAPARYRVRISKTDTIIGGRKGPYQQTFSLTCLVLESDNELLPAGVEAGYIRSLDAESRSMALGDIKQLTMAAVGFRDEAEFEEQIPDWTELCEAVVNAEETVSDSYGPNPLADAEIFVVVVPSGRTDAAGRDYGRFTFEPAGE